MLAKKYIQFSSNLFVENKLLKFVIVVLTILLVLSFYNSRVLIADQKVILVPIGLSDKVEIGNSSVDEVYLQSIATYVATLMYETTPSKVQAQYKIITTMMTPKAYNTYGSNLLQTSSSHMKNEISQTMTLEGISIQMRPEQVIKVTVLIDKSIFGTSSGKSRVELSIGYEIKYGKIFITSLNDEKIGDK